MKHPLNTVQTHTTSGRHRRSHLYKPRGAQQCPRQFICLLCLSEVVWAGHGCQTSLPFRLERKWSSGGGKLWCFCLILGHLQSRPLMSDCVILIWLTGADCHWLFENSYRVLIVVSPAPLFLLHLWRGREQFFGWLVLFFPVKHSSQSLETAF